MSWQPKDKEVDAVIALPGPRRYSYWVKRVADQEVVWGLWGTSGWALAGDDLGNQLVPVWPHPRFAALCVSGLWSAFQPRSIELSVWMTRWIPGMISDGRLVAVFPTPDDRGISVAPERLREDLERELALYG